MARVRETRLNNVKPRVIGALAFAYGRDGFFSVSLSV